MRTMIILTFMANSVKQRKIPRHFAFLSLLDSTTNHVWNDAKKHYIDIYIYIDILNRKSNDDKGGNVGFYQNRIKKYT